MFSSQGTIYLILAPIYMLYSTSISIPYAIYLEPPQEPLLALCLCGVVVLSLLPNIGVAALLRVASRSAT